MAHRAVSPPSWVAPKGYANGIVAEGKLLFVAGQIGWDPTKVRPTFPKSFAAQFEQALRNMVDVVRAAGGQPSDLARVTVYVVDKKDYLRSLKAVGAAWKMHVGRYWPAMTLVEVSALLEPKAKVEIEGTAVLSKRRAPSRRG